MRRPVVHLELHTGDLAGAREFYAGLCDWRPQRITVPSGSYLALTMGDTKTALGILGMDEASRCLLYTSDAADE